MSLLRCFSKVFLGGAVLLTSLSTYAADNTAQVGKVLTPQGNLQSVVVITDGLLFYVSETGQIQKVTPNPNQAQTNDQSSTQASGSSNTASNQPLQAKYRGQSALTGGRRLTEVNNVKITYYSMMGQRPMGVANPVQSSPYGSRTMGTTTYSGNNLAQAVRDQDFSAGQASSSSTSSARKVRTIGSIQFSYYSNDDRSGNGGKIKKVGDYRIIYYSRDDLTGRAGKVRSFKN